ncbi:MAG TPA: 2-C-methyl-D-erythritol 2,4-cyclodiphosphate synthase [Bryobacteraceae bacterium]|nr:2-C-methyl-D-erythritol 2,4-cyclodiphosphate synthase [Bryobacteraceae bacterium]
MTQFQTGIGYDLHRLVEGRRLVLGGVAIPHSKGLAGHSDADVISHAATDALLGAAGLGDIGEHFPPSDPQWKDAPSLLFLERARDLLAQRGFSIVHLDIVIVLEQPKILPYRAKICENIARALGVDPSAVSLKAKTAEGIGPVGAGEAAEAHAVATVRKG